MKTVFKIALTFLYISLSFGQEEHSLYSKLNFKHFSTQDGLSQRSVVSILQDYQGYIWFGTRYGLNKFDGQIFKNYYSSSTDPNSLSNNRIFSIIEDREKNIWVGTKNGLNKYIPAQDSFERVFLDKDKEIPYDIEIIDIKEGKGPFLWIATSNGLHRFNTKTYRVLKFKHNKHVPSSISSNQTNALVLTKNSELWICTSKSIDKYEPKINTFIHFSYPENASPSVTKSNTTTLYGDSDNNIWLGYENGLALFDKKDQVFKDFKLTSETEKVISSAVRAIYEDQFKNLWIGTYNGVYYLNKSTQRIYHYTHDKKNQNSLSDNSIYKIFEDAKGDLWVGTWAGGVNYLDKHSNAFSSYAEDIYQLSLNNNIVSSIVENQNNDLWIGTEGGGINVYNQTTGKFSYYMHDLKNPNSLSGNNVKAILKDSDGNFWIGTHADGLNKITLKSSSLNYKRFKSIPGDTTSLSDNKITCLAEDYLHNIWIGTNSEGLTVFNKKTLAFSRVKDPDTLIGTFIHTISKTYLNNKLWVGSDNGLFKVDINSRQILPIKFQETTNRAYIAKIVISVYQESSNILWIGTEGDGLYKYNLSTQESQRFGIHQGLPDEVIYAIQPDDNNSIWVSTNNGLSKIDLRTNQIKNFSESDGLQGKEFNYGASNKTKRGELIFGGTNGFTIFNPNETTQDSFIPPIVIRTISVSNKPYLNVTDSIQTVTLTHKQNDVSFDFVALGFSKPNKTQYAYKLEGFDEHWNTVENKSTATYTNLEHGDYEFKVKAANSDGLWNKKPASIKLKIRPPLWKTWQAYVLYTVLVLILIFITRKILLTRLAERNALKEARLEKAKMEELNKLKLQLFTNISHDFRTPLTLIVGPLKRLMDNTKENNYVQSQLEGIYRNTNILLQLINQLLDFRKAESGKLKMHFSKHNMVPFLEDIKLSFNELAAEKDIHYSFTYATPTLEIWFDKIEIKKALLNILSNAFKFTPVHGIISMHLSEDNDSNMIKLEIHDSGKGIPEKDLPFIFDRYFQLGQHSELRSGTGVGLTVAKDIIDLHQGTINVSSQMGKGTCFTIFLPMGSDHIKSEDRVIEDEATINGDTLDYYAPLFTTSEWIKKDAKKDEIEFNNDLPSVLIVEDNAEVRALVVSIFTNEFNVFEAKNGRKGIKVAQLHPIDIIISDIMMPKMDGIEFCNAIKTDILTSHIPVILLTARTSAKIQKTGYETGADAYISKPFDPELLKLQVENLLKSRLNLIEKFKKDFILEPKELNLVSTDEIFLKKAMDIVEENFSDPQFMAVTFAKKMHMSQSVLYKKLKALTGQTISEFIRAVKFKKAGQLLSRTDMSVADVAYQIGFNDLKYFRKCFKETFNQTPSQYRKENPSENTNSEI
ncbi:two-component regulator propeller domain-containing protein [Snuella sedimenti]|uniref:histidine kinase n=1 Tax=Snuella sedimenti TaxID=2798802 RepID=A0A8J7IHA3_9FLAO|nr:two-component regulator propeller domain-containing protein [Snuella sedimenti]MBJ6368253.1 response regulator [Snuella sedimenti]